VVDIPAVCGDRGALFVAPNLVGGSGRVEFRGSKISPCPACGGVGGIFDGVYDAATNTAKLLITAATKPNHLKALQRILHSARESELTYDQITARVKKDVPELGSVADLFPKTRVELYAFIALVLTLIGMVTAGAYHLMKPSETVSEKEVRELIERAIRENTLPQKARPLEKKKVGRNEPCPFGSGKKYKHCCLLKQ